MFALKCQWSKRSTSARDERPRDQHHASHVRENISMRIFGGLLEASDPEDAG